MKKLLPLLMFLTFSGFRPVAVTTQSAKGINENFNSLASEIERRSLNQGGIVHQNLKISSSAHVTGDVVVDGTIKTVEITVSTITATVGAVITVGCPTGFTKVAAQSRVLGCMQTDVEGTSANWMNSLVDCFDTHGARLPSRTEWWITMNNYALTNETTYDEWFSDSGGAPNVMGASNNSVQTTRYIDDITTSGMAHRCWIPSASMILN